MHLKTNKQTKNNSQPDTLWLRDCIVFFTTAENTIKNKRVENSKTERNNPSRKKQSWRKHPKAHTARKVTIFATPLQAFMAAGWFSQSSFTARHTVDPICILQTVSFTSK